MPSKRTGKLIKEIKYDKKGNPILSFDDGTFLILNPDAYSEMPLFPGKSLTDLEIKHLEKLVKNHSSFEYALKLVSSGSYSIHDVYVKLEARKVEEKAIKEILSRLRKERFLDDEEFAKIFIEEKEAQLYGKKYILDALSSKHGVKQEILDNLSFSPEEENASIYAERLSKQYKHLPLTKKKEKIYLSLLRRGFSMETANSIADNIKEDKKEKQEYLRRIYLQALRKYPLAPNDYEQREKIYLYLARHGFSREDINMIMEEENV
ncbi:MAG: RecX family transcriptional regulator [Bacilli bacterium]|nr:RecX family transcriptional regulator [Bacilli bacterium]